MYTLTRKLTMVCLAVVLSVLAYGCGGGGSSPPELMVTGVNTDEVTTGLTADSGTYPIQPGRTANAGDVTFACPEEGSSCEVTVADDGTVTSTGGMATAMDSASAVARLAALERARVADNMRDAAVTARMEADNMRDAAVTARMEADNMRDAAVTARMEADNMRDAAVTARMEAEERATAADQRAMDAGQRATTADQRAMDAGQRAMVAEAALDAEKLEFAQILDVITNVDLDLAMNYKTIEAGAYVIQPGAPMDVDDVKFECPDGVLPCVVLVIETTENDDTVTTIVVSLGGAATGGNTVAIMDLRAANALTTTTRRQG